MESIMMKADSIELNNRETNEKFLKKCPLNRSTKLNSLVRTLVYILAQTPPLLRGW